VSVCPQFQLSGMVLETIFNADLPAAFTWAVDNAIRSSSSEEETPPVRSYASLLDNAINSDDDDDDDVEEDFQLSNNSSLEVVYRGDQSCSANTIKKSLEDLSLSNHTGDPSLLNVVSVNGKPISNCDTKKAEKLAGPILPGNYWLAINRMLMLDSVKFQFSVVYMCSLTK